MTTISNEAGAKPQSNQVAGDAKEEEALAKLNIVLSRLDKSVTSKQLEDLLKLNNYKFKDIKMLACQDVHKLLAIAPKTTEAI